MLQATFTVIRKKSVRSTQDSLKTLLAKHTGACWPLLVAEQQTGGRGLGNNRWESEAGMNLTFSFAWFPHFIEASDQFMLSKTVALALHDMAAEILSGIELKIKWPNDLWANGGKLAGILIEHQVREARLEHTLVGVGLNLNQTVFRSGAPNPVSMKQLTQSEHDPEQCLSRICHFLEVRYAQLREHPASISADYLNRLYRLGEPALYELGGKRMMATITGLDPFGRLMLLPEKGEMTICDIKEVRFL